MSADGETLAATRGELSVAGSSGRLGGHALESLTNQVKDAKVHDARPVALMQI